jgi:DNA helicase-2/ATP-dependent DNA helicase PcrA
LLLKPRFYTLGVLLGESEKILSGEFLSASAILQGLNDVQKSAVQTTEGPVLILAGAGSGKTNVLTRRIAYLLNVNNVSPFHLLAVTFTNKAAEEMKHRVERLVGADSRKIWIGTFHSIFGKILRFEADKIGYSKNYTIYDAEDQLNAVKVSMEFLNISQELYSPNLMRSKINRAKNTFETPAHLKRTADNPIDEKAALIYEDYERRLKKSNAFDFDDLIIKPIELFQAYPDVLHFYQEKFRYIHIDEYQDTNRAQYILMNMLALKYKNICVVGDDDQSIYGWRHADIGNILNFEKDYPDAKVYKLEQNYRSSQNILKAASEVVKNNVMRKGKTLWTQKSEGSLITILECGDDRVEARAIAQIIQEEIHTHKRKFSDFAMLYRTNAQTRVLEEALRQYTIPYVIVGGLRFYERKEIKDILSYLKLIANPSDAISLKRVINYPTRGIGKTTMEKLEEFSEARNMTLFDTLLHVRQFGAGWLQERATVSIQHFTDFIQKYRELKEQMALSEWVRILIEEIGILKTFKQENTVEAITRYENVVELMTAIGEFSLKFDPLENEENMLDAFLKDVALVTDIDQLDETKNAVSLMTIHSSKGLEFPVVIVAGLEEGLFPHENSVENESQLEEERRLFYVSVTRAQRELYLSFAKRRMRFNNIFTTYPSRFLEEIPKEVTRLQKANSTYGEMGLDGESNLDRKMSRFGSRRRSSEAKTNGSRSLKDVSQEMLEQAQVSEMKYRLGQHVEHPTFGSGRITESEGLGDKQKVTILFSDGIERRLMVKYANLMLR